MDKETDNTPEPAAPAATPNPQTITLADHHAFVEKARQEEKTKLHDKINKAEALANEVSRLNGELAQKDSKIAELEKSNQQLKLTVDALEKSKDDKGRVDAVKAVQEAGEIARKQAETTMESRLSKERSEWEKRFSDLDNRHREVTLREAKANIIQELGGKDAVIESMIQGTTEQELRESALKSKTLRDEIIAKAGQTVNPSGSTSPKPGTEPTPSAPPLPNPSGGNPGGVGRTDNNILKDVRTMTPAEYAKHREAIQAETGRIFQSASGR